MARHAIQKVKLGTTWNTWVSSGALVAAAVLTFFVSGWEQGVALTLALTPLPLCLVLLQIYGKDADPSSDEDDKAFESGLKVGVIFGVGWIINIVTQAANVPAAQAGPGLLLAGIVAMASWTFAADVIIFAIGKAMDRKVARQK